MTPARFDGAALPRLGTMFDQYFREMGLFTRYKEEMMKAQWPALVGEAVASHVTPLEIQNGVLFVEVDHPTWQHQLQYMKRDMIVTINRFLQAQLVKDLMFSARRR